MGRFMTRAQWRARAGLRLMRRRAGAAWDRAERVRKAVPWAGALLLNGAILVVILVFYHPAAPREEGERVIPISIFQAERPAPPPPPPEPEPEPEVAEEETPPSDAPPVPSLAQTPDVELLETDAASQVSGVVGLDCAAVFDDPARIAACAGGAEVEGWRGEILRLGEDWSRIAREMSRDSGVYVPDPRMAATPERMEEFDAMMERRRALERYRNSSPITSRGADTASDGGAIDYNRPVLLSDDSEDGAR